MISINLTNLAKIGQLDPVPWSADLVKRNLADYDGELVTDAALNECLKQARAMVTRVERVMRDHPELGG